MRNIDIWLIAISLAMDCFAVSIAIGIIIRQVNWKIMIRTAFAFGFFQMMMTIIGWTIASYFQKIIENIDHWIAFGLLAFLGIRMISESFKEKEKRTFNPCKRKITLLLAIATSIDAVAVGISFACVGLKGNILSSSFIIGIVAFVISCVGFFIGILGDKKFADKIHAEFWGGIILIGIGTKILIEHLC